MLAALALLACSMLPSDPDEMVGNPVYRSANRPFAAVLRRHEVPDFQRKRAGDLPRRDEAPARVVAALYEGRTLIAEIPFARNEADRLLVTDSGEYVIGATWYTRMCAPADASGLVTMDVAQASDPLVTIYRSDGTRVGQVRWGDVLVPHDLEVLRGDEPVAYELHDNQVLIVSFAAPNETRVERRIELATAHVLDEKRPIFP